MSTFYLNDTAVITAATPDGSNASQVTWTIRRPDLSILSLPPVIISPVAASANLSVNETLLIGEYRVAAQFLNTASALLTVVSGYTVLDPLETNLTSIEQTFNLSWMMLEDCFDSETGGPYLRDASQRDFDLGRMYGLAQMALFQINNQQPATMYSTDSFPYDAAMPLLAKAILIEMIKHLMRSYVEQPQPTGSGQISYFERRDYLDRWNILYQQEMAEWKTWLAMFKRQEYNFGRSKLLVDSKQGRKLYYPALRTRYPRIGGYYG